MSIEQNGAGESLLGMTTKAANGAHNGGDESIERLRALYPPHKPVTTTPSDGLAKPAAPAKTSDGDLFACSGVRFKGEIECCDTLMVQGEIEAQLHSRRIVVAAGGSFIGRAEVEDAEIAGRFEGTLQVSGKLIIRRGGRVSGEVSYGQLEIEPGGELRGSIDIQAGGKNSIAPDSAKKKWSWKA